MPRSTTSAPKRLVTPRTSSAGVPLAAGGVTPPVLISVRHLALDLAISRSNWTLSAIAKRITMPTQM